MSTSRWGPTAVSSGFVRSGPLEWEMLAGPTWLAPLEAKLLDLVVRGGGPCGELAGADFRPWTVVDLYPCSFRSRRSRQRLCSPSGLSGNLDTPVTEIVGDFEVDRGELDPTHFFDQLGEAARPTTRLPAEYRL